MRGLQVEPERFLTEQSGADVTSINVEDFSVQVGRVLCDCGVAPDQCAENLVRIPSVIYMVYWHHRLRNNLEEQSRIRKHLIEYIGASSLDVEKTVDRLLTNEDLFEKSREYAEKSLVPVKTVDLVIMKPEAQGVERETLCVGRTYYPFGAALPGGILRDSDESNDLNIPGSLFAALRVAGEKVLKAGANVRFSKLEDSKGRVTYIVKGKDEQPFVKIYPEDQGGYRFKENIRTVIRPSDPRHIVDTIAYRCELVGAVGEEYSWKKKSEIMDPNVEMGGFAFGHHRELNAFITARTSLEKEREMEERTFVRGLIDQPKETYERLQDRFEIADNPYLASFPEFFPVVDRLMDEAFKDEVNDLCRKIPLLAGVRDKVVISLRHVSLKRRDFCPYVPTLMAIAEAVAFFDLVSREKRAFYAAMSKDQITEHNPATTPNASYHMYRYKYRLNELIGMHPDEIVIPTFESLTVMDLMRVRGVPVRFLGLATDFLYVDEFEQSPEEFYMHDANHSWRMALEDKRVLDERGMTREEMVEESDAFMKDYLPSLKICETDTEEERELKKIKLMILFEVIHEDARPLMRDVVAAFIQVKEGGSVPFEMPQLDPETGYLDVVDLMDTGISTLSYVRNKLQHGFYDHIDAQESKIVDPRYRTSEWIARAAYEMLVNLDAKPIKGAELDTAGRVSYEWLLKRTCAVGPDNIHVAEEDPLVAEFGDGGEALNKKRYLNVNTQTI